MNNKEYRRAKIISKLYNVPLYIGWLYRFNPYDIKYYIKRYGHK